MKEEEHPTIDITTGSWVRAVLVLAVALALFQVRHIILIVFTAIVIASSVEPAAVWARKKNIPRLPTILAVYALSALLLAALFYFLFLPLIGDVTDFIRTLPTYTGTITTGSTLHVGGNTLQNLGSSLSFSVDNVMAYLNSFVASLSQGAFSSVSRIFGGVASFVIIIVLSFYLAVQEDGIGKFLKVITPLKQERYIIGLWRRSQHKIGLWMQGQLLLGVIVMVLDYLGLMLIGVPHALLLAVLAGAFEIIPLFGPILSAIPGIFVAYAFAGPSTAIIVAGLYLVIQQFENHLIYPLVVKKVVGVPPMVAIVALLIGGELAGVLGVLIAVPLATVVMELLSDFEQHKTQHSLNDISKA